MIAFRSESEHQSERSVAGSVIVPEVFGFVNGNCLEFNIGASSSPTAFLVSLDMLFLLSEFDNSSRTACNDRRACGLRPHAREHRH